jgi:hypothetical protein
MLWLALEALHAGEVHRPRESRAAPALPGRSQLGAAVERAHPQAIRLRAGACRCGVERRAAFGAERVHPLISAFRGLGIELGGAASQDEGAGQAWHRGAKGGAGKGLAIGAMADSDLSRIDFSLKADLTAMTASGNFHRYFFLVVLRPDAGRR